MNETKTEKRYRLYNFVLNAYLTPLGKWETSGAMARLFRTRQEAVDRRTKHYWEHIHIERIEF